MFYFQRDLQPGWKLALASYISCNVYVTWEPLSIKFLNIHFNSSPFPDCFLNRQCLLNKYRAISNRLDQHVNDFSFTLLSMKVIDKCGSYGINLDSSVFYLCKCGRKVSWPFTPISLIFTCITILKRHINLFIVKYYLMVYILIESVQWLFQQEYIWVENFRNKN